MTREEAIKIATGLLTDFKCESDTMVDFCNTIIKALEQEPKIGHWITTRTIEHDGELYCDKCGYDSPLNKKWNYCPNCGIKIINEEGEKK